MYAFIEALSDNDPRAILARTPAGNVLWDCLALIDDATVDLLNGLGRVAAIAI